MRRSPRAGLPGLAARGWAVSVYASEGERYWRAHRGGYTAFADSAETLTAMIRKWEQ